MSEVFQRTEMLIGKDALCKLGDSHVAVFGVGGVGGCVVEGLVRSGVGRISIFDNDDVCESNINRQIIATTKTIGQSKVDVAKARALEINPDVIIDTHKIFVGKDNIDSIDFSGFDYVVDAVDTVTAKLLIIEKCKAHNVPVISSMGTGNKLDPTAFTIADISKTSVCPLAKVMRYELKKRGIKGVKVLYSQEKPIEIEKDNDARKQTPASISFVPTVAGFIIAGQVIKDIIG